MRIVITGANSAVGQSILRVGLAAVPQPILIAGVRSRKALAALPALPAGQTALIDANLDAQSAAREPGIRLTGLDEMIRASVASSGQRATGA